MTEWVCICLGSDLMEIPNKQESIASWVLQNGWPSDLRWAPSMFCNTFTERSSHFTNIDGGRSVTFKSIRNTRSVSLFRLVLSGHDHIPHSIRFHMNCYSSFTNGTISFGSTLYIRRKVVKKQRKCLLLALLSKADCNWTPSIVSHWQKCVKGDRVFFCFVLFCFVLFLFFSWTFLFFFSQMGDVFCLHCWS